MKRLKKAAAIALAFTMAVAMVPQSAEAAKKKVKLDKKTVTVIVGKTVKLKLKNNKKKVKWTVISGKKNVTLSKKKKTGVTIKGKKAGKAKVQAKVGKKKYVCKVTVKKVNTSTNKNNSTKAGTTSSTGGTTKQPTQKTNEVGNPIVKDGVTTWDCIYFGNYWQNDTNGDGKADQNDKKEQIKWRVLSVNGNDVFLLADQNLDVQSYHGPYPDNEEFENVTWATCSLRTWLNDTFINTAFTSTEQVAIKNTTVINEDNPYKDTEGGENTTDKVYLLSIEEASNIAYGFNGEFRTANETREAKNTAYVKECGAWTSTSKEYEGNGYWWLRSPGNYSTYASYVYSSGNGISGGSFIYSDTRAVRPVLHLNLSASNSWSYAGKVISKVSEDSSQPTMKPTGIANPTINDGVTTWDCVWFGNYWQKDTNGDRKANQNDKKEPIKWRVLSVDGKDAFLMADQNLDSKPYNEKHEAVTWENCSLRTWLNSTFLNTAFTSAEQTAIKDTMVVNDDNPEYGTEGGENTMDKVYLLSITEASNIAYGFDRKFDISSETRRAANTAYVEDKGYGAAGETDWWYLRSPSDWRVGASIVDDTGCGYYDSVDFAVDFTFPVRPVLHLDLSNSALWSYAGEVKAGSEE